MKFFKPTANKRTIFFIIVDIILSFLSAYFSFMLRFNFKIPEPFYFSIYKFFIVITFIKVFIFFLFKIYFVSWRFFGFVEAKNILKAHIISYSIFTLIFNFFSFYFNPFPRSVILIDFSLSLIFIGLFRISKRIILEKSNNKEIPVLIFGANQKAQNIIKSCLTGELRYFPVAIIENEKHLINTYFSNLKVYHVDYLENVLKKFNIASAIIAKDFKPRTLDKIFEILKENNVNDIKKVVFFEDENRKIENISIEDLLARKPKDLDIDTIKNFIKGKKILITGAGGSIGSELSRLCYKFDASELFLIDNSEFNLYKISEQIPSARKSLISILDYEKLSNIFQQFNPDIVIHSAAYKHVHICEENINECIENNVKGSINVINLSIKNRVKKVVVISTDKAVRPTSVMGASKRVVEIYAQNVPSEDTEVVTVRFGNVLGSSGSVIPKFKEQILNGGPVTVTHPEVTRYFMLISEACKLVLQASAMAKGGEIYILDMGEPVKIVDLAKKMIRLYNKENIKIEFTGLRKGEKLYEELLINEAELKTKYQSIFIAKKTTYNFEQLKKEIEQLLKSKDKIEILKKIVPEYNPNH